MTAEEIRAFEKKQFGYLDGNKTALFEIAAQLYEQNATMREIHEDHTKRPNVEWLAESHSIVSNLSLRLNELQEQGWNIKAIEYSERSTSWTVVAWREKVSQ